MSTRITREPSTKMQVPRPTLDLLAVGSRYLIMVSCLGPIGAKEKILRLFGFFDLDHSPQCP